MSSMSMAAAVLSFITWGVHVFAGGPTVARPLLAAKDLDPVARDTLYFGWHLVTLLLLAMGLAFLHTAMGGARELAILMTALAASFTLWNVALVVWKRRRLLDLPQWALFGPITVLGLAAVWR
jgi:hypothetical protein